MPTRRSLLLSAAATLLLALVPFGRGGLAPLARLRQLAGPPESARVVGRAYLARYPEPAATLLRQVAAALPDVAQHDDLALARALDAAVRADFAAGRTVMLQGWLLSRTEARLCALAA